jgi:NADH-quinone oxidoreductase subunit C
MKALILMFEKTQLITALEAFAEAPIGQTGIKCGCNIDIRIHRSKLQDCAKLLLQHEFYLSFLTAVHVSPACEVIYQFGHFETSCRLQLRAAAGEDKSLPSIAGIYQGADWHEREAHDFFGVTFTGHPNLKPLILTREERDFKPLLKPEERLKSSAVIFPQPQADGN